MKKSLYILLIPIFVVFCSRSRESVKEGDAAPEFTTMDHFGQIISLEDLRGKRILLHFWADWCSECRAEFPRLQSAYLEFQDKDFEIVAVNVAQSVDHVTSFVDEFNLTFPMLLDEQSEIAGKYGIRGLPTNFFIKPDLTVHKMIIGWVDEKQISRILNEM